MNSCFCFCFCQLVFPIDADMPCFRFFFAFRTDDVTTLTYVSTKSENLQKMLLVPLCYAYILCTFSASFNSCECFQFLYIFFVQRTCHFFTNQVFLRFFSIFNYLNSSQDILLLKIFQMHQISVVKSAILATVYSTDQAHKMKIKLEF